MCGRYSIITNAQAIYDAFKIVNEIIREDALTSYNAAPSQCLPVILNRKDKREFHHFYWGLVPAWIKDEKPNIKPINAKAETAHEKPYFRGSLKKKRCLVPATGFFEWDRVRSIKRPYNIKMKDGGLFAMAGLWDARETRNDPLHTFCLLTTDANEVLKPIHHRMPVIIDQADYDLWLDEHTPLDVVKGLLKPYPAEVMERYEISSRVNSAAYNQPDVIAPAHTFG